MADPMDANLILLSAVVSGVLGGFLYKGLRSKQAGLGGSRLDPNPSWEQSIELPPGFVVNPHEKGWTVTSGPRLPLQASAEIPRVLSVGNGRSRPRSAGAEAARPAEHGLKALAEAGAGATDTTTSHAFPSPMGCGKRIATSGRFDGGSLASWITPRAVRLS